MAVVQARHHAAAAGIDDGGHVQPGAHLRFGADGGDAPVHHRQGIGVRAARVEGGDAGVADEQRRHAFLRG
ncbi:hypothetical protein D3C71_1411760 [compost metagenome]